MRNITLLAAAVLFLGACNATPSAAVESHTAPPPVTDVFETFKQINAGFTKLKTDIQITPPATLVAQAQLEKKTCEVALPVEQAAPDKPLALPALYQQSREGVMVVATFSRRDKNAPMNMGCATGYMLSESGVMATNYHVAAMIGMALTEEEGKKNNSAFVEGLIAMDCHGKAYSVVEVLAADKATDIAIVRLGGSGFHPLSLRANAQIGENVFVIGHPEYNYYMLSTGIVTQYFSRPNLGQGAPYMCISSEFGVGSSGGPVFDAYGKVVGMVSNTHTICAPVGAPSATGALPADAPPQFPQAQMVIRNCVPAAAILKMIEAPKAK